MKVELWTDGSGTTQGNPGGWACVLKFGEHRREFCGGEPDTTNNRMEMTALLMGLRALKRPCDVEVHTDSEYVMKAWTEGWLNKWRAKNWRKVKNVDLWQALLAAAEPHRLTFVWHKGHTGVVENELCDKLAGEERRRLLAA